MSILSEPRRKKRISVDPQNMTWKKSDNIGKSLMTKMNWSEGKGLGKHEQGAPESLKLNANFTGKGLGCDRDTFKKEPWMSHHDDFDNLLASLNSKSSKNQTLAPSTPTNKEDNSIQSRSRKSKARVHYKFTRGKDLSLANDRQKAAIFGVLSGDQKSMTEQETNFGQNDSELLKVSTISTTDYYKEKMAKFMNRKSNKDEEIEETKSKKKRKRL